MASEQQTELDYGDKSLSMMVECGGYCGWRGNLDRVNKRLFCPKCGHILKLTHVRLRRSDRMNGRDG